MFASSNTSAGNRWWLALPLFWKRKEFGAAPGKAGTIDLCLDHAGWRSADCDFEGSLALPRDRRHNWAIVILSKKKRRRNGVTISGACACFCYAY